MTRNKDLEHCGASVQHLSLTVVFSESYQIMVSGSACHILHGTMKLPSGKKIGVFVQGAIILFICKCSHFFS